MSPWDFLSQGSQRGGFLRRRYIRHGFSITNCITDQMEQHRMHMDRDLVGFWELCTFCLWVLKEWMLCLLDISCSCLILLDCENCVTWWSTRQFRTLIFVGLPKDGSNKDHDNDTSDNTTVFASLPLLKSWWWRARSVRLLNAQTSTALGREKQSLDTCPSLSR